MARHTLIPKTYRYTFGPSEPALTIAGGDSLTASTRDCRGEDRERRPIPAEMQPEAAGTDLVRSNPLVGPVFVEGARRGDSLRIRLDRVRPDRDFGMSKQSARFGSLSGEWAGHPMLYQPPIQTKFFDWKLDLDRGIASIELPKSRLGRAEARMEPFVGCIGVAPPMGRVETSMTPGEYGGNMDWRGLKEGVVLHLPVWVDGAFLSFGDVHALQGDGEMNGTAVETSAEVTLGIEVLSGRKIGWPRAEDDEFIAVLGSARPIEDCVRLATFELLGWLVADYGFDREEAWQLMGQLGGIDIANIVDPQYTVAAKFPKRFLPSQG